MTKPISCDLYDYIEIACMFRYRVCLTLYSQQSIEGNALTTGFNANRNEVMILEVGAQNGTRKEIETAKIKSMDVLTPNARFSHIDFG